MLNCKPSSLNKEGTKIKQSYPLRARTYMMCGRKYPMEAINCEINSRVLVGNKTLTLPLPKEVRL